MFGSLPTGVFANAPWQTLLFRPNPLGAVAGSSAMTYQPSVAASLQHMGAQSPPDYLLLELFNMPVVEPYPISEPLTTAGRINMNYQIQPFTYINRDTGLRAVFKSERMLSIPNADAGGGTAYGVNPNPATVQTYKSDSVIDSNGTIASSNNPPYMTNDLRFDIDPDKTLEAFQFRFNHQDIFRSPAEICSIDLIPEDPLTNDPGLSNYPTYSSDGSGSAMVKYWEDHALTGDNSRERPYADIYPRLTTKSNTFTIHMRVQTLKQAHPPGDTVATDWQTWREGTDLITGEYRGSETVERSIDPNDTTIPNYATTLSANPGAANAISTHYKFRVVNTKQFAP
jgi:uncharacterized protein (TIGR02600 family)